MPPNPKSLHEARLKAAKPPGLGPAPIPPRLAPEAAGASGNGHKRASWAKGKGVLQITGAAPPLDAPNKTGALIALRHLITFIGDDPDRAGLQATPGRVLKAWRDTWGAGYRQPAPALVCFPEKGIDYDEMVAVRQIGFYSMCEHHMAPFFGTADIGYLPKKKKGVVGLSKLARVVDHFSRRLQVQERLTAEIADYLLTISPDVAVRMTARHFCMCSRGVMQANAETTTTVLRGRLRKAAPRAEFLGG